MSVQQYTPYWCDGSWSDERICRFIGGRRAYNRARSLVVMRRQKALLKEYQQAIAAEGREGKIPHLRGFQTRMAKKFGVHRSTICRDLKRALHSAVRHQIRRERYGDDA